MSISVWSSRTNSCCFFFLVLSILLSTKNKIEKGSGWPPAVPSTVVCSIFFFSTAVVSRGAHSCSCRELWKKETSLGPFLSFPSSSPPFPRDDFDSPWLLNYLMPLPKKKKKMDDKVLSSSSCVHEKGHCGVPKKKKVCYPFPFYFFLLPDPLWASISSSSFYSALFGCRFFSPASSPI